MWSTRSDGATPGEAGSSAMPRSGRPASSRPGGPPRLNRTPRTKKKSRPTKSRTKERTGAMELIIGIDLGTTNSEVAIVRDGRPVVLPDEDGDPILPSIVGLDPEGRLLVGKP